MAASAKCMELFGVWDDAFYKRHPPQYPSDDWIGPATEIGLWGWNGFKHLFFHPDGTMYGVVGDKFYKRNPPVDGSDNWIAGATMVGTAGWSNFKHLFFHPDGTLYGVWNDKFYKRAPPANRDDDWIGSATLIGRAGWNKFKFLFFDPYGILYGVLDNKLYKSAPPAYRNDNWIGYAAVLGEQGWADYDQLFFMADGHLFGVHSDRFYRRTPPVEGSENWLKTSKCVGTAGWSNFKFLIARPGNAKQWPPVKVGAVWPPGVNEVFTQGNREYQFFRAALKWLESEKKVPQGTLEKFLQEAMHAGGMMEWRNVFSDLGGQTPQELYRSTLNRVSQNLSDYTFSAKEGERRLYQMLTVTARRIANNRGEVTGHGNITEEWERVAKDMEQIAKSGAEEFGDEVEEAEAPTVDEVEAGFGFSEAADVTEAAAASIGAEEIIKIAAIVLLL